MGKCLVYIDGFNLYHAIADSPLFRRFKWLNLSKFANCFLPSKDALVGIKYFTAYTTWDLEKVKRHKVYVKALEYYNVEVILGQFRYVDKTCRRCGQAYNTFEEKRTDVNIAINLFQAAINDVWDTALIVSGDSDLIPAIEAVKRSFPSKKVGIVIPIGRRAEELKQVGDFHRKVKLKHLETCQLDDVIDIGEGVKIERPDHWK